MPGIHKMQARLNTDATAVLNQLPHNSQFELAHSILTALDDGHACMVRSPSLTSSSMRLRDQKHQPHVLGRSRRRDVDGLQLR